MTLSGILAFIELLNGIYKESVIALAALQAHKDEEWFKNSALLSEQWKQAKTPQELKDVSKKLADLISDL